MLSQLSRGPTNIDDETYLVAYLLSGLNKIVRAQFHMTLEICVLLI